jgi:hypothetical protein
MTSLMFIVTSRVFVVDTLLTPQHLHVTCPSCFGDSAQEKIGRPANKSGGILWGPEVTMGPDKFLCTTIRGSDYGMAIF